MAYTATVTKKGQVTIPKPIRDYLDLSSSDRVSFVKAKKKVIVKPVVDFLSLKGSVKGKKYSDKKADQAASDYIGQQYAQKEK